MMLFVTVKLCSEDKKEASTSPVRPLGSFVGEIITLGSSSNKDCGTNSGVQEDATIKNPIKAIKTLIK